MNHGFSRELRRAMDRESQAFPVHLVEIDIHERGTPPAGVVKAFRSRGFMVQVWQEADEPTRLSIHRTTSDGDRWHDGISWDDLQRLKREAGFGHMDAIEVYPADRDVVNVANIRHLWLMPEGVPFAWRRP